MKNKIFFQSSLPRSGSTLLQNILAQNPDFYTTPTSGLLELLYRARNGYSDSPEFKAQDEDIMKNAFMGFCRGGLEGYFNNITNKKYIVDKSRAWGVNYDFLNMFYENPKIVCMLRDPRDVFTSMEKQYRKHPHVNSGIVINQELKGTTVEKRIDIWAAAPPVGISFDWIKDMISQKIHNKILFIKYEDLTKNPQQEMDKVYDFFEVDRFQHDFTDVKQVTHEDDRIHGIFGDHIIRKEVKVLKSEAKDILGSHVCNWIRQNYDWFYTEFKYY
jgi:sulfotransferase